MVLDLVSGAVVFLGDGRGAPFWERVRRYRAYIRVVAMAMFPAYISGVANNLPKATIVFDHFHLIKMYNDKLPTLRRNLHNQAAKGDKRVLKGTHWLFRKNPENLNDSRNEKQRLDEASLLNRSLATASYPKEDLRQL